MCELYAKEYNLRIRMRMRMRVTSIGWFSICCFCVKTEIWTPQVYDLPSIDRRTHSYGVQVFYYK
jgi:hypothetical protein